MGGCAVCNRENNLITTKIPENTSYNPNIKKNNENKSSSNNNQMENDKNTINKENIQGPPITTNINNINININTKRSDMRSSGTFRDKYIDQSKIIKPILNNEDKKLLKEIFSNHFLFKNKSSKVISSIIDCLEMMIIPENTTLFKKGARGYYFYVIKEGKIQIMTECGEKILNENDTFGELALIQNKKRTASAKSINNCKLLLLNGKKFREIISETTEMDLKDRMSILSSSPIFSSLDNNKLNALANGLINCSFEPNQRILYQGDNGQSMYIIKSGKVKCSSGEHEIRFLGPRDYFGESAILFNMNRSMDVTVEEAISDLPEVGMGQESTRYRLPKKFISDNQKKFVSIVRGDYNADGIHSSVPEHLIENKLFSKTSVSVHQGPGHIKRKQELLALIPVGESMRSTYEKLTEEGRIDEYRHLFPNTIYGSRNRRLLWNEPSFTVTSHCLDEILHPVLNRAITPREAARLQSFPDWYQFAGPYVAFHSSKEQDKYEQIGDAIPPLLACAMARQFVKCLPEHK